KEEEVDRFSKVQESFLTSSSTLSILEFMNYEKINPRMCRNSTTSLKIHTRNHNYKSEMLEIHAVAPVMHVLLVPGNPGVILFYKDFGNNRSWVCAGLSTHLQEYKSKNAQLEKLLTAERELSKSYEANIKQLQKDLSETKNAEIEALLSSTDALKRQAAQSEGNLASIQVNMESMMRNQRVNRNKDDAGSRRGASICRTKSRRGTCSA
ncbi:hypothetical protein S83_007291, partial [Arachis hypogaea]